MIMNYIANKLIKMFFSKNIAVNATNTIFSIILLIGPKEFN